MSGWAEWWCNYCHDMTDHLSSGHPEPMTEAPCPNEHGPDGVIACWSPGGPCPDDQTVCESCGPCDTCWPGEHPLSMHGKA